MYIALDGPRGFPRGLEFYHHQQSGLAEEEMVWESFLPQTIDLQREPSVALRPRDNVTLNFKKLGPYTHVLISA